MRQLILLLLVVLYLALVVYSQEESVEQAPSSPEGSGGGATTTTKNPPPSQEDETSVQVRRLLGIIIESRTTQGIFLRPIIAYPMNRSSLLPTPLFLSIFFVCLFPTSLDLPRSRL